MRRQFIAFVVSLLLVALLLMVPVGFHFDFKQDDAIEVILSKQQVPNKPEQRPEILPEVAVQKPIETPVTPPVVVEKIETPKIVENSATQSPKVVKQDTVVHQKPKDVNDKLVPKLPSSAVIFNSAYGKVKLYELDDDFKARTGHEGDFKFREIVQPEWRMVTKLIDEEVDKPRVTMNFYSEGIVGSTERFFDKISYKKVFTTRYGTKIMCGGVGPLAICSWK